MAPPHATHQPTNPPNSGGAHALRINELTFLARNSEDVEYIHSLSLIDLVRRC